MQTAYWLGVATVCLLGDASAVTSQEVDSIFPATSLVGTSRLGPPGLRQVAAAHNRGAGILTMLIEGGYGSASSFLVPSDTLQLQSQSVRVGYAPSDRWDLFFGEVTRGTSDSAYYSGGSSTWTQFQLQGAYHFALPGGFFAGGALLLNLPANTSGLGFAFSGFGGEVQGRASWRAHPRVEVDVNVGYLLDRTEHLLSAPASRMQRIALASAKGSRATWGLGVEGWFNPGSPVMVAGLLELSGQWSPQGAAHDMPVVAAIGARLVPRAFPVVEISAGADVRVSGAPEAGSFYAGVLPWFVFAQLAVHVAPFVLRDPPACEPSPSPEPAASVEVARAPATGANAADANQRSAGQHPGGMPAGRQVVVSGSVLTAQGHPIPGARVVVAGHPDVLFTTDATTGRFRTLQFDCSDDEVEVTATTLQGHVAVGSVPCKDLYPDDLILVPHRTARPPGVVVINVTGKNWRTSDVATIECAGVPGSPFTVEPSKPLRLELPPRLYRCTISAPHSLPMHRLLEVHSNRANIFNIDLYPRPTRKGQVPRHEDGP